MTPFDHDHAPAVTLEIDGKSRTFDIDDPDIPKWVRKGALASGAYPYTDEMSASAYEEALFVLHIELVKLQYWLQATGHRVICLFEGRDAAGKGGAIFSIRLNMSPRSVRVVALPKPSDRERGEWYFQRYIQHFPSGGEMVLFDRSWYNRAGVEPVMGFCTPAQAAAFLPEARDLEAALARDGVIIFKYWLQIGRQMQILRFYERRHDPRRIWKLSPMDIAALPHWDAYTNARREMIRATHTADCPWTVVRMNDKRRGRLNLIRHLLRHIDYVGRDIAAIGEIDDALVLDGPSYLGD